MRSNGSDSPSMLGKGTGIGLSPACISRIHCSERRIPAVRELREHVLSELSLSLSLKSTRELRRFSIARQVLSELIPPFLSGSVSLWLFFSALASFSRSAVAHSAGVVSGPFGSSPSRAILVALRSFRWHRIIRSSRSAASQSPASCARPSLRK